MNKQKFLLRRRRKRKLRGQPQESTQCLKHNALAMNLVSSSRRKETTSSNKVTTQKL